MRTCPTCHGFVQPDTAACPSCGHSVQDATMDVGAIVSNRYEILEQLGAGGMGTILRAYDRVLEEEVALEVIGGHLAGSEGARRRFRAEIKLARQVAHRNVCRIYEYGALDNRLFL